MGNPNKIDMKEKKRLLEESGVSVLEMKEAIEVLKESCLFIKPKDVKGGEILTSYFNSIEINIEALEKNIDALDKYITEESN